MEERDDNLLAPGIAAPVENRRDAFATTHWSVVSAARGDDPAGAAALEELCRKYWLPAYVFVRRRGFDFHEAQDLTQSFFTHVIERRAFNQASRDKGKFRSFLLAALLNFMKNEWDRQRTLKRGGQRQFISLDETAAEQRYQLEPVESVTPETLFERRWALTLLEQVLARLKQEYAADGKADLIAKLEPLITGEVTPGRYAELALDLGMKEAAVRMALSRTRRRFGELLRQEIAQTLLTPAEVDDEIRHLFAAAALAG